MDVIFHIISYKRNAEINISHSTFFFPGITVTDVSLSLPPPHTHTYTPVLTEELVDTIGVAISSLGGS